MGNLGELKLASIGVASPAFSQSNEMRPPVFAARELSEIDHAPPITDRLRSMFRSRGEDPSMSLPFSEAPPTLAEWLNDNSNLRPPSRDVLNGLEVPSLVIELIGELVKRGISEKDAIIAALHLFLFTNEGRQVNRRIRRQVLKSYKALPLPESIFRELEQETDKMRKYLR